MDNNPAQIIYLVKRNALSLYHDEHLVDTQGSHLGLNSMGLWKGYTDITKSLVVLYAIMR